MWTGTSNLRIPILKRFSHWWGAVVVLWSASKFIIDPNGGKVDTSPNVENPFTCKIPHGFQTLECKNSVVRLGPGPSFRSAPFSSWISPRRRQSCLDF